MHRPRSQFDTCGVTTDGIDYDPHLYSDIVLKQDRHWGIGILDRGTGRAPLHQLRQPWLNCCAMTRCLCGSVRKNYE